MGVMEELMANARKRLREVEGDGDAAAAAAAAAEDARRRKEARRAEGAGLLARAQRELAAFRDQQAAAGAPLSGTYGQPGGGGGGPAADVGPRRSDSAAEAGPGPGPERPPASSPPPPRLEKRVRSGRHPLATQPTSGFRFAALRHSPPERAERGRLPRT